MAFGCKYPVLESIHSIVVEASSSEDRAYMRSLGKNDIHQINGTLVQKLYQSVLDKNHCDFGDIPKSDGDIEKVKYYKSTVECLDTLDELLEKNQISEPAVADIRAAISNVKLLKPKFAYAFQTKQEYMIILYNTTVMAIVDATSMLIAEYMNFIVGPDQSTPKVVSGRFDKSRGIVSLDVLRQFNALVKSGKMGDSLDYMLKEQKSNFAGTAIAVTALTIAALVSVTLVTREAIFFFYKSRISFSEYLDMQASFLEMNKLVIENSKRSASEKKDIVRKQEKIILKMRKISDKLKINNQDVGDVVRKQVKEENALMNLSNMEKQLTDNQMAGQSLQFI